jgi:ATP phosphoribosyltransferase regulatory subunit
MLTGRTPIQAGCELFGSQSAEADLEVITLMLESLRVAGLARVHLDLSHVAIFETLTAEAGLSKETGEAVFDAVARRSVPELDELLGHCPEGSAGARLRTLATISGGPEALARAREVLGGASGRITGALDQLDRVAAMLSENYPAVSVGFDFCELRGYNYHTGLVFAAYAPGHGDAVGKGGRYDAIGRDFGRARPATGFSLDVRALVALGGRPGRSVGGIWAPADADPALDGTVAELRMTETVIRAMPEEQGVDPRSRECDRALVKRDGQWVVEYLG